jgi:hypothetical protein
MYIFYGINVDNAEDVLTEYYHRVSAEAARRGEPDEFPPLSEDFSLWEGFGGLFDSHEPRNQIEREYLLCVDCDYPSRNTDYEELDRKFKVRCQNLFDACYGLTCELPKPDFIYYGS